MMKKWILRWLGVGGAKELPVVVRLPVTLVPRGREMSQGQLVDAIHGGKDHPAFLAVVQLLEGMASHAQAMAKWDQRLQDGTAEMYLMAQGYLDDLLADVADCMEGREPVRKDKGERIRDK